MAGMEGLVEGKLNADDYLWVQGWRVEGLMWSLNVAPAHIIVTGDPAQKVTALCRM